MHISDISPYERELLSRLRFCPASFLGEKSLRNFRHMSGGYQFAMQTAGLRKQHNLLPDGLNGFTADYLRIDAGTRDCFTMIMQAQPDDRKALDLFFEILDAYLEAGGLKPLARIRDGEEFQSLWKE